MQVQVILLLETSEDCFKIIESSAIEDNRVRTEPFYEGSPSGNDISAIEDEDFEGFCGKGFGAETVDNLDSKTKDDDPTMQKLQKQVCTPLFEGSKISIF